MAVQESVYEYEGSINKFLMDDKGSTLVAVYGLPPVGHADDPTRGVLAALRQDSETFHPACATTPASELRHAPNDLFGGRVSALLSFYPSRFFFFFLGHPNRICVCYLNHWTTPAWHHRC